MAGGLTEIRYQRKSLVTELIEKASVASLREQTKVWLLKFLLSVRNEKAWKNKTIPQWKVAIKTRLLKTISRNSKNESASGRAREFLRSMIQKYPGVADDILYWVTRNIVIRMGFEIDLKHIDEILDKFILVSRNTPTNLYDRYLQSITPEKRISEEELVSQTTQWIKNFREEMFREGYGRIYKEQGPAALREVGKNVYTEFRRKLKNSKSPAGKFLKSISNLVFIRDGETEPISVINIIMREGFKQYATIEDNAEEIARSLQKGSLHQSVNAYEEFCAGRLQAAPAKTKRAAKRRARSRVGKFGETVVRPEKKTAPRARKSQGGGGAKGVDGPGRETIEGVRERFKTRVEKIRVKPVRL